MKKKIISLRHFTVSFIFSSLHTLKKPKVIQHSRSESSHKMTKNLGVPQTSAFLRLEPLYSQTQFQATH